LLLLASSLGGIATFHMAKLYLARFVQLGLHFLETSFLLAKVSVTSRTSRLMSFALAYHRRNSNGPDGN